MRLATSMPPVRHETVCRATALLIATSACTVSRAQLCDNPIAYWKFDSGSLLDYSGHGNTLTNSGGTFPQGILSNGLGLTTGHFAEAADAPSLNPTNAITVAAWYLPVAFVGTGNDPIVTKGFTHDAAPDYQYHLSVSDLDYASGLGGGRMGFGVAVNDVFVSAVSPAHAYQLGHWYFLAGTYDGASVRFFLNGVLVDQHEYAGTLSACGKPVRIGAFNNRTDTLPGTIDEVRLYGRALSPDEIRILYVHPDAAPLVEPPARPTCPAGSIAFSAKAVGIGPLTPSAGNGAPSGLFDRFGFAVQGMSGLHGPSSRELAITSPIRPGVASTDFLTPSGLGDDFQRRYRRLATQHSCSRRARLGLASPTFPIRTSITRATFWSPGRACRWAGNGSPARSCIPDRPVGCSRFVRNHWRGLSLTPMAKACCTCRATSIKAVPSTRSTSRRC